MIQYEPTLIDKYIEMISSYIKTNRKHEDAYSFLTHFFDLYLGLDSDIDWPDNVYEYISELFSACEDYTNDKELLEGENSEFYINLEQFNEKIDKILVKLTELQQ